MVLCNLPSDLVWTQLDMELRYIRDQPPIADPSTSISLTPGPGCQVRCDSGAVAGPWITLPSRQTPTRGTGTRNASCRHRMRRAAEVWARDRKRSQLTAIAG